MHSARRYDVHYNCEWCVRKSRIQIRSLGLGRNVSGSVMLLDLLILVKEIYKRRQFETISEPFIDLAQRFLKHSQTVFQTRCCIVASYVYRRTQLSLKRLKMTNNIMQAQCDNAYSVTYYTQLNVKYTYFVNSRCNKLCENLCKQQAQSLDTLLAHHHEVANKSTEYFYHEQHNASFIIGDNISTMWAIAISG